MKGIESAPAIIAHMQGLLRENGQGVEKTLEQQQAHPLKVEQEHQEGAKSTTTTSSASASDPQGTGGLRESRSTRGASLPGREDRQVAGARSNCQVTGKQGGVAERAVVRDEVHMDMLAVQGEEEDGVKGRRKRRKKAQRERRLKASQARKAVVKEEELEFGEVRDDEERGEDEEVRDGISEMALDEGERSPDGARMETHKQQNPGSPEPGEVIGEDEGEEGGERDAARGVVAERVTTSYTNGQSEAVAAGADAAVAPAAVEIQGPDAMVVDASGKQEAHTVSAGKGACQGEAATAAELSGLLDELQVVWGRWQMLFEWVDGPLVTAMRNGEAILIDEISLADDSVLERINSVLEPGRSLVSPCPDFWAHCSATADHNARFVPELFPVLTHRF